MEWKGKKTNEERKQKEWEFLEWKGKKKKEEKGRNGNSWKGKER